MKTIQFIFVVIFSLLTVAVSAQNKDNSQWRGSNRNGIYQEKDLVKKWDENGPKLLWKFDGLGEGHNSVAISNNKIYVTGLLENQGKLFVFDRNGKLIKQKIYANEWVNSYEGPRSTITINDGLLYLYSGLGDLIYLDQNTLQTVWQINVMTHLSGKNISWGVTESPLIIGNKLIITAGGKTNNVVAYNKKSGKMIWSSAALGERSAYCSPIYIDGFEIPIIATHTENSLIGLNASTGKLLWSITNDAPYGIQANSPLLVHNDKIFFSNSRGAIMLKITDNGKSIEKLWSRPEFNNYLGGYVAVGDFIYGAGNRRNPWLCLDINNGEIKYSSKIMNAPGNIIYADEMLYCYSERGELALVNPSPEKFDVVSKFRIQYGTKQHWAHPVIKNGVLYLRHGNSLMAYQIK